ncbi:MAG: STT3 domain-containing protein [Candidatus Heimdallarchaeaceae archaeon]
MSGDSGISGTLGRFWRKIVDHFEDYEFDRVVLLNRLSLLIILIAGVMIRLFSLMKGYDTLIKAFDPYVQLVSAEFISENGFSAFVHWFKDNSWYPYGFQTGQELYWGVPVSAVIIHAILNFFTINVTIQQVAFFSPVVYGLFTIIASYFLGKEAVSTRTGLFTAFFMAFSPAFLSRSTAGFFDNESIGILFTVLTLYFFIRAIKRGGTISAFLAGISLGLLIGSWGAYRYVLDLLPLAALFLVLTRKLTYRLIKTYTITIVTALSIGFLIPRVMQNKFYNIEVMIPVLMIGFLILVGLVQNLSRNLSEKTFKQVVIVGSITVFVLLTILVTVFLSLGIFSNIADKFWAVILPGERTSIPIISSVSEHQPMTWAELFNNVHIMMFLMPLGIYYCLKKPTDVNIIILTMGVTTIYFSGSMVRLVLLLAPSASLLSAMAIDKLLYTYSLSAHGKIALTKRKLRITKSIGRDEAVIAYLVIFGLLLTFTFHSIQLADNYSQSEMAPVIFLNGIPASDWQEALMWLRENGQSDGVIENSAPVVLSWWDYGYWITNYGNTTTLVDNATTNSTQIGMVGTMLMWNFTESVKMMYKYNIKYVLINSQAGLPGLGSDLGKALWCIRIAESTVPRYGMTEDHFYGLSDDERQYLYYDPFYDSVLYRLAAYDKVTGFAWTPDFDGTPTSQSPGLLVSAENFPVFDLKGPDGITYFSEVFRSYGLASSAVDSRRYPLVRIFEVIYPENIEQLSAELNYDYPEPIEDEI